MSWRAWLDASPAARIALALMRDATGREAPLEALKPVRPGTLPPDRVLGFWSLAAGVGVSTVAALVAHRSASGGRVPLLVDLDRRVPVLALRAGVGGAHIVDALLQPKAAAGLVSRWNDVLLLPGCPELHRSFDGPRIVEVVGGVRGDRPAVIDLGCGAEALDADVVAALDRLCVVAGPSVAQLQAAFCAVPLLASGGANAGLVVVGAGPEDAARIASRLPWPLLAAIPRDPYLAQDDFAARLPTLRAVDALIRGLA